MDKLTRGFKSREEEAGFWDSTPLERLSPGEYESAVVRRPKRPLSATFAIRLDPATVDLVRRIAEAQGLGATQLVRSWVVERLRLEREVGVLAEPSSGFPVDLERTLRKRILESLLAELPRVVHAALECLPKPGSGRAAKSPGPPARRARASSR